MDDFTQLTDAIYIFGFGFRLFGEIPGPGNFVSTSAWHYQPCRKTQWTRRSNKKAQSSSKFKGAEVQQSKDRDKEKGKGTGPAGQRQRKGQKLRGLAERGRRPEQQRKQRQGG